ncbi:uncharacterized protein IL334_000978 [Kwoniella shivajii]|uniref:C2H2-type domain-containing protein n=1 Tax=Kwoniella shivajii TaxID=564305 RepID=A0ABZ1CR03_9TREE|nr:hypothetical protein IL334_000978 [Kwoniella shivajii]
MGNCLAPLAQSSSSATAEQDSAPQQPTPEQPLSPISHVFSTSSSSSRQPISDRVRRNKSVSSKVRNSRSSSIFSMGGGPSLDALRNYATLSNPTSSLPPSKLLLSSSNTLAVFDAYPKAKYHFLVLPRYPFPPLSNPESKNSIAPLEAFDDLKSLLMKMNREAREDVLISMSNMAREVEEMIRDEMLKTEGFEWKIDVGFHAIPSMKHVHLHVISDDRISPSLKTKKHHNSFRPDLGFFIPIMEVQRWIEDDSNMQERVDALSSAERLLNTPLTCHKCDEFMTNIPKLKTHLEKHFVEERAAELRHIARHGTQRNSDEEMF